MSDHNPNNPECPKTKYWKNKGIPESRRGTIADDLCQCKENTEQSTQDKESDCYNCEAGNYPHSHRIDAPTRQWVGR